MVKYLKAGLSHVSDGTNCQDSITVINNDSVLVAALADGLGSLKYSEFASKIATRAVCDYFSRSKTSLLGSKEKSFVPSADELISLLNESITAKAAEQNLPLSEMDCTLSFVAISKQNNRAVIGLLGDSAVCIIGEKRSLVINGGSSSGNATYAVLDKDAPEHLIIKGIDLDTEGVLGFILTSDGLENELYMKGSARIRKVAADYFNTLINPKEAESVIAEHINKITVVPNTPFDDDISIVILSRAIDKIELPADPTWLCSCGARNPLQNTYCRSCHKDFIKLYSGVNFREYGGKVAFFEYYNANPAKERMLIGLSVDISPEFDAANKTASQDSSHVNQHTHPPLPECNTRKGQDQKTSAPETDLSAANPTTVSENQFDQQPPKSPVITADNRRNNTQASTKTEKVKVAKTLVSYQVNTQVEKSRDSEKKTGISLIVFLVVVCLVVGIILGCFFTKLITSNHIKALIDENDSLKTAIHDLESSTDQQLPSSTSPLVPYSSKSSRNGNNPMDNFIILDNGDFYWGITTEDGKPDGSGILIHGEDCYIGPFKDGKKNGEFVVVSLKTNNNITVTFESDIPISTESDIYSDSLIDSEDSPTILEENDNFPIRDHSSISGMRPPFSRYESDQNSHASLNNEM